jgi:hypothetical protein
MVSTLERRQHRRYEVSNLEGTLVLSVDAVVSNISLSGMAVESPTPFTVGQSYSVRMGTPELGLELTATTRWCELSRPTNDLASATPDLASATPTSAEAQYKTGLSFDDLFSGTSDSFRRLLESRMAVDLEERLCGRVEPKSPEPVHLSATTPFTVQCISVGGMLVATESDAELDSRIKVDVVLGGDRLLATSRVASVAQSIVVGRRVRHQLGLQFLDLGEEEGRLLTEFVATLSET